MKKSIFHYSNYRNYLLDVLGKAGTRSGLRQKLAAAIQVQPSHISQVLKGGTQFTLEPAEKIAQFLQLPKQRALFFLVLVHKDRAGTLSLKRFYEEELHALQEEFLTLSKQVKQL